MPNDSETDTDVTEPPPEGIKLARFDLRSLWRATFWGCAAAIAVTVVAGTALSDIGAERLKVAIASVLEPMRGPQPEQPPQQLIALQKTIELETRTQKLADTVRELTADRDRLKGRLAILEQSLDDITGAIKKQSSEAARQPPREAVAAPATPPPAISAPPTTTANISERPAPATPTATPPLAAAPDTAPVPMPPIRTASIPPPDQPAEQAPVIKRMLGVDLGGASNIEALRTHWAAIKANIGPEIVGMSPSFMQRTKTSGATELRLVVGPFPTSGDAIRLCSKLTPMRITCRAGMFNVQQFAER